MDNESMKDIEKQFMQNINDGIENMEHAAFILKYFQKIRKKFTPENRKSSELIFLKNNEGDDTIEVVNRQSDEKFKIKYTEDVSTGDVKIIFEKNKNISKRISFDGINFKNRVFYAYGDDPICCAECGQLIYGDCAGVSFKENYFVPSHPYCMDDELRYQVENKSDDLVLFREVKMDDDQFEADGDEDINGRIGPKFN